MDRTGRWKRRRERFEPEAGFGRGGLRGGRAVGLASAALAFLLALSPLVMGSRDRAHEGVIEGAGRAMPPSGQPPASASPEDPRVVAFPDQTLTTGDDDPETAIRVDVADDVCVQTGQLIVRAVGRPPFQLASPTLVGGCQGVLAWPVTLAPGTYTGTVRPRDTDGRWGPAASAMLTVEPTDHVVILVPGIDSRGEGPLNQACMGGYPAVTSGDPTTSLKHIRGAFETGPPGSPPVEDITFYVLDYPAPPASSQEPIEMEPDYCYSMAPGLERAMVPRFDVAATREGLAAAVAALRSLVESFPDDTRVDVVGHSQGGIVALYWLATMETPPNPEGTIVDRLHSLITLDSPLRGIVPTTLVANMKEAMCRLLGFDAPTALERCLKWDSMVDMEPGSPIIAAINSPWLTTARTTVVTLTCDRFCVGSGLLVTGRLAFATTLPGVLRALRLEQCGDQLAVPLIGNHPCFLSDPTALGVVAGTVRSEVVDSASARDDGWTDVIDDALYRRSGRTPLEAGRELTFTIPASGGDRAWLYFSTPSLLAKPSLGCAGLAVRAEVRVNDGIFRSVVGSQADGIGLNLKATGRPVCTMLIDDVLARGPNTITIRALSAAGVIVDAVVVGPK